MKKDVRTISSKELEEFFLKNNQKSFVAKQVMEWLWKKSKTSFSEMKNISKLNRELLDSNYIINSIDSEEIQVSNQKEMSEVFNFIYSGASPQEIYEWLRNLQFKAWDEDDYQFYVDKRYYMNSFKG